MGSGARRAQCVWIVVCEATCFPRCLRPRPWDASAVSTVPALWHNLQSESNRTLVAEGHPHTWNLI